MSLLISAVSMLIVGVFPQDAMPEGDTALPNPAPVDLVNTTDLAPIPPRIEGTAAPETEVGPMAFADLTDEEIFERVAGALEAVDTMTAKFSQISPSGTFFTGSLSLDRPGKLRFDYDDPSDQLIVAAGGLVYVHDAALETTDSYPVGKTPLRFLLSRRIDPTDAAVSEVYRTADTVAVLLTATDEDVAGELALVFSAPDFTLQEWVVIEPNGAATQVTLSDIQYGERLPGRLFRVPNSGGTFLRDR